uniref:Toxin candidate TRINITY_DN6453_c0_g1_i1 n=1 Tax=Isarachnanthus nocturnus TaxID=1240238 RepID=A0A7G7WZ23_9CNID|nr:toxin candidate TRINITY_DN6453_c0_g1_i1 [Isarachnanthus nocturnus]
MHFSLFVTILCAAVCLQCVAAKSMKEGNSKKVTYQVLVGEYKAASCDKCDALKTLDGCSAPFGKNSFFYRDVFTPACFRHDICYRCGAMYSWTRKKCDEAFYRDMKAMCASEHAKRFLLSKQTKCKIVAFAYFSGVSVFGAPHFRDKAADWCDAGCAEEGGNPETTKDPKKSVDKQYNLKKLKHGTTITDDGLESLQNDSEEDYDYNDILPSKKRQEKHT